MYDITVPDMLKEEGDFQSTSPTKIVDESEQSMEAGYSALFETGGEEAIETYWAVRNEQKEFGRSPTAEGIRTALHQEETEELRRSVEGIVADFNVPVEDKISVLQADLSEGRVETTMAEKLMNELLMEEDTPDDLPPTPEQEHLRTKLAGMPKRIAEYRGARHALLVQQNLDKPTTAKQVANFAQAMIPFVEQQNVAEALFKVGEGEMSITSFFAMGHAKEGIVDSFTNLPLEERTERLQEFAGIIKDANTTNFMTNELLENDLIDKIAYGSYSEVEKWVDDVVSWLDLTIVGGPIKQMFKRAQSAAGAGRRAGATAGGPETNFWYDGKSGRDVAVPSRELATTQSEVVKDSVRSGVKEISPIRMASEVNEERAKLMFKAVVEDTTEETAQAMGGASKADVVADAVLPEMAKEGGRVRPKPENIDSLTDKAKAARAEIIEAAEESSVGVLTPEEFEKASAHAVSRMKEATGVVSRTKMFQHQDTPTGTMIHAVYGPEKGGWANADQALDLTEIALREHGVTRDDLYILEKGPEGEYIRVDEPTGDDFLVGLDFDYDVKFSNVEEWTDFEVKRNFLDRSAGLAKIKATRNLIDAASMFDPHITLGANARVDKSAKITKDFLVLGDEFMSRFVKQPERIQEDMTRYIKEANDQQKKFDVTELKSVYNLPDDAVEILRGFRNYWDTVWEVRNISAVKALRNRGFGIYSDAKNQDSLFTRPVDKGQVTRGEVIYDPELGRSRHMSEVELTELYDKGGKVGKLRRPQQINGQTIEQMIIPNNNKWRGLNNSDIVYPYRNGYFHREYTAPHFIDVKMKKDDGTTYWKPVAHSGSAADAEVYMNRYVAAHDGVQIEDLRRRGNIKDPTILSEYEMDTFMGMGINHQKVRGEKLEDATAIVTGADSKHILGPVDAIIQSARTVGNQVGMGDFIEATKQRFVDQFGPVLKEEKGQVQYPANMDDIGTEGFEHTKMTADARSTYEYISMLEFGYTNAIDNVTKSFLKAAADVLGEKSLTVGPKAGKAFRKAEEFAHQAAEVSPTSMAKNIAFTAYIATSPQRQLALNAHQATMLTGNFPGYVLSQRLSADLHAMFQLRLRAAFGKELKLDKASLLATGRTQEELNFMHQQYLKSGLAAAIDQSNLIRGALMDMAESNRFKNQTGRLGKAVDFSRKWGFSLGEDISLTATWLAHYDRAKSAKPALNATDFLDIAGRSRNFTLNMNRAGDMPYNHNSLSMVFMYLQFSHKSALQITNRVLTRKERAALAGSSAIQFGLPGGAAATIFSGMLPDKEEHPELHEALSTGLTFYTYNKFLEFVFQQASDVDWSSFSPYAPTGIFELMHHLWTTPFGEWLSTSPSGQLIFGGNPRLTNAVKSIVGYLFPGDPTEEDPVEFSQVMHDIASISTGYSMFYKAGQQLMYKKAFNAQGRVIDENVTTPEAFAQILGAPTQDTSNYYRFNTMAYQNQKEYREDIKKWYKDTKRRLASQNLEDIDEVIYNQKVIGYGFKVFGETEIVRQELSRLMAKDAKNGVESMYQKVSDAIGFTDEQKLRQMVDAIPDDDFERKAEFWEGLQFMKEETDRIRNQ